MLGSIRKFSGTIYAKILLGIIILPFVFWGMGSSIRGGSKNVIVVIDKEKYSVQQFSEFIKNTAAKKVEANEVERFLSSFIGEKLIEKEIEHYGIKLSDNSLGELIKHQKDFKRDNKFSRAEYEKFLIKNNIPAVQFENILSKQEKKKQLLDFIAGGISPSKFLVNISYDRINQERTVELIKLNDIFKSELNFSEDQIKNFFLNNKDKYTETYKSVKIIELNPKKLVGDNEFTDLFFKKIDEIEDSIIVGEKLDNIIQKFNLEKPNLYTINTVGKNISSENNKKISKELIKKIFRIDENEPTVLIDHKNEYYVAELVKVENIEMSLKDESIRKNIILDLSNTTKRKLTAELVNEIKTNNFKKIDFDKLSKDESVNIQKIYLKNQNDDKILKKDIVNQIYVFSEKQIIVVSDLNFAENYLIYIDKVKNVKIDNQADEYEQYLDLSKSQIVSKLYNSYDNYLKKRYEIEINYQALDVVKNYFN